jgi:hypothetical protein
VNAPDDQKSPGQDLWNGRGGALLWIWTGWTKSSIRRSRKTGLGLGAQALDDRPQDRFLVTCRFQGYFREGVPLGPRFVEFHVRPLDDDQVERFVRDWFGAAYGNCTDPDRGQPRGGRR